MAKPKTKKCPIDTTATFEEGWWLFRTAGQRHSTPDDRQWGWRDSGGVNLWVFVDNAPAHPTIFAKSLDHAVMFAHGFDAGCNYGRKEAARGG